MQSPALEDVALVQERMPNTDVPTENVVPERRTILQKAEEYLLELDCGAAYTQGILLQLLTTGKVRVDFRDYSERLQLEDKKDRRERAEVVVQLEQVLESVLKRMDRPKDFEMTQKVIIQTPSGGGYLKNP
jgi:hypothetical protein